MSLNWENDYLDLKAEVLGGVYRISSADSLGKHEVSFRMGTDEYYVGYVFGEDEAKAKAENHHKFIRGVYAKQESN